jgi:hypothetical protein
LWFRGKYGLRSCLEKGGRYGHIFLDWSVDMRASFECAVYRALFNLAENKSSTVADIFSLGWVEGVTHGVGGDG